MYLGWLNKKEYCMSENGNGKKSWTENFRIFTPILVTISIFLLGAILSTMNRIDENLFKHLTNDEIHTPRAVVITRAEFDIYQNFRNKQNDDLKSSLCRIEDLLSKGKR